jgi:hypothetical protein
MIRYFPKDFAMWCFIAAKIIFGSHHGGCLIIFRMLHNCSGGSLQHMPRLTCDCPRQQWCSMGCSRIKNGNLSEAISMHRYCSLKCLSLNIDRPGPVWGRRRGLAIGVRPFSGAVTFVKLCQNWLRSSTKFDSTQQCGSSNVPLKLVIVPT